MNRLTTEKRIQVVRALLEGNSIRSTVRMTGVAKNTVVKLLVELGEACLNFQDTALRNLPCKRIQCDEIWGFVGCKERHVAPESKGELGQGDVWVWTALDPDTKLIASWMVGKRTANYAHTFIEDLKERLANRIQLTTDGLRLYVTAVEDTFDYGSIDYAIIHKVYGESQEAVGRYSPADCTSIEKRVIQGEPDMAKASTSHVERQNLTIRMSMRRFTRLTNAFSKKVENLIAATALHFMWYNFGRPHQTLSKGTYPTTPAMAAGVTKHPWTVEEILSLIE